MLSPSDICITNEKLLEMFRSCHKEQLYPIMALPREHGFAEIRKKKKKKNTAINPHVDSSYFASFKAVEIYNNLLESTDK